MVMVSYKEQVDKESRLQKIVSVDFIRLNQDTEKNKKSDMKIKDIVFQKYTTKAVTDH